jgi:cell filamentation protein, protein adenylyltransferase
MILSRAYKLKPPYSISSLIINRIASISEKIGKIKSAHLSKPPTQLRRKNRIKTIQSSLEIEGNILTVEQITAILENKRVLAPYKDIIEVQNAIKTYDHFDSYDAYSLKSLCKAHKILMSGLIERPGELRTRSVGIMKGSKVVHLAPSGEMVKPLMNDLFSYLKNDEDLLLIKSCVFHYEFEFIHPFMDGNGRMGRLWQTVILNNYDPVFAYLPIETLVKERQSDYYSSLNASDNSGNSTLFIEFMLEIIDDSLEALLHVQNIPLTDRDRVDLFRDFVKDKSFSRQEYLKFFRTISPSTASRDLRMAVENKLILKSGDKRTTMYKFNRTGQT